VFEPLVVTVGEPVVVEEYLAVGTLNITTPDPPALPERYGCRITASSTSTYQVFAVPTVPI
jgi:hypothetical protein